MARVELNLVHCISINNPRHRLSPQSPYTLHNRTKISQRHSCHIERLMIALNTNVVHLLHAHFTEFNVLYVVSSSPSVVTVPSNVVPAMRFKPLS